MKRLMAIICLLIAASTLYGQGAVNFGRKVRPLLADKCFACHGLDDKTREGGLRLDTQAGLYGAGDSGDKAVVPGSPDQSAIVQRILETDETLKMPPGESGKSLSQDEMELIKQWISEGAKWEQHWSLVAPVRPPIPNAGNPSWGQNEIDRFILARLVEAGLEPSEPAEKEAILRRVTYDLTGLPPTPAEVAAFLADSSEKAYENLVDRLLQSSHYGEHMARYWLDAARYGDTHGLHLDNYRMMWPYRDWVVNAFNTNVPYDQFTVEQLAGDLLPNATMEQIVATGFNRCNVTTSEGGALPEEYEVYYTNDRVATMSTVWMGISMGCVTCHEHKFDPFAMKDFYQLYAFFNSLDGPVMDGNAQDTAPVVRVTNSEQRAEIAKLDARIQSAEASMAAPNELVDRAQSDWEAAYRGMMITPTDWDILKPEQYSSVRSASFERLEDDSLLVGGTNANQDVFEITGVSTESRITAIRLEGLSHPSLTDGGVGRSANSNVVLTEFEVECAPLGEGEPQWQSVALARAWADHEQPDGDFKVTNAIDGRPDTGWAINGHQRRENRTAIFAAATPFGYEGGTRVRIRLRHESIYAQHQFGRVRLATTLADKIPQLNANDIPAEIATLIAIDPRQRDAEQQAKIRNYYRASVATAPLIKAARDELALARKQKTELENALPASLVWRDAAQPKPAHILLRGAYDKPGELVSRNTPAALPPLPPRPEGTTPTRLDLARWLLLPDHPLTARVAVNRFWQQYFGVGIVETSEDFGSQGTPPSHPELLDWLAVDFRESGWNVKRLQKAIVMSSTYRQSATASTKTRELDPRNRLLSRGPRFRMDAEMVRDTSLAASGLLIPKLGGPSVKPYQPEGIWEAVAYTDSNTANFKRDSGESLYRRSLYTFWKRTAPPPVLTTLDAPSRETCSMRRPRTNTPLAALALMNDEQFVEASRRLAERVLREGGDSDQGRIAHAFLLTVGRLPTDREVTIVTNVLQSSLTRYEADLESAQKLTTVGESRPAEGVEPRQLAAWTIVSNMLLNMDETVTK